MRQLRRDLFVAFLAALATLAAIPILTYVYFASSLTSKEEIMNRADVGVTLLDRNNVPFFTFYQAKIRKEIPLSKIPVQTRQAFIAIEDKDFYYHSGFSLKAILRSLIHDIQDKNLTYGGSTITQQLVKNSLLTFRKDFLRKYQEVILAQEIERRYSKDEILGMYLNSLYLGEGSFGIEAAANTYFDKKARDLDLAESSILAAILPAPSRLSLLNGNFNEAKRRQRLVLERMLSQKYISLKQKEAAENEELALVSHPGSINSIAPHFALMVKDQLESEYGEEKIARSGFRVKTSLDLNWQKYAEAVVARHVKELEKNRATNGAAVVLDPKTGEILSLVGSKDWYDGEFGKVNIILSQRPPGSAFKPIVYIRAFERGLITPATILQDVPTSFANFDENKYYGSFPTKALALEHLKNDPNAFYQPRDFDNKFRGPVTVRRALANSLNIPAVEVMKKVGVEDVLDFARSVGITTLNADSSNYGLSLVLGAAEVKPLDLTKVYGAFANNGMENEPTAILQITDKNGNLIYSHTPSPTQVMDKHAAFLISSILSDNKTRAEEFGNVLNISRVAAVKTGTTENFKDAWTVGYTPSLVVGVWVGNNFGKQMDGVAGSLGAAPIWRDLMEKFLAGTSVENFEQPEGVVKMTECEATASARVEYFIRGTQPVKNCPGTQNVATGSAFGEISPKPI